MPVVIIKNSRNWKYILVEESLPSVHKALSFIPITKTKQNWQQATKHTFRHSLRYLITSWSTKGEKSYIWK